MKNSEKSQCWRGSYWRNAQLICQLKALNFGICKNNINALPDEISGKLAAYTDNYRA